MSYFKRERERENICWAHKIFYTLELLTYGSVQREMSLQSNGGNLITYRHSHNLQQHHHSHDFKMSNSGGGPGKSTISTDLNSSVNNSSNKRKTANIVTQKAVTQSNATSTKSTNYDLLNSHHSPASTTASFASNPNNISKLKHYFQRHLNQEYNNSHLTYVKEKSIRERQQQHMLQQKKDSDYFDALATSTRPHLNPKAKSNSFIKIKTSTAGESGFGASYYILI